MGFAYKPIPFDDLTAINPVSSLQGLHPSVESAANLLKGDATKGLILIDGFLTSKIESLVGLVRNGAPEFEFVRVSDFLQTAAEIEEIIKPYLPMDRKADPELIFGKLFDQDYRSFFDLNKVNSFLQSLPKEKTTVLYGLGCACSLFRHASKTIYYIDVTPKDAALRVFDGQYQCIGSNPSDLDALIRQTYFIDNELAVNLRRELIQSKAIDGYMLDSELSFSLLSGDALYNVCDELKARPLRAKPIYVEGVWGGQFLRRYRRVPEHLVDKVAWSFELIHTEASIMVDAGGNLLDIPFLTVMDAISESVLGSKLNKQFDGRLPIRFNYDDTWHSNGNMSIQVHPTDPMAQQMYGDFAAQNEAYYVVMTGHGAKTFCGFKGDGHEFLELARQSEDDATIVPYEDYIHAIPSDVGRQIFLPAGTVHGSGRNQIVLELGTLTMSAYTYKIYDYTRMDITGKPRPLHTKLAEQALDFSRDGKWVMENIAFPPQLVEIGKGWREFLVGKHDSMYFATHRIEMETGSQYQGDNGEGFCVITVVDGEAARIQSAKNPNHFFDAKYLDVILVPASMGRYEVIAQGKQPVVLHKAFVREDRIAG
jgi:mannose-6-phosphate isomerase class I